MNEIGNLINAWDPIDFFPLAPQDEYVNEIKKIEKNLHDSASIDTEALAKRINDIFKKSFGDDVYTEDLGACRCIAQKFLEHHNT